ncbi:MAG: hypothetical protein PHO23_02860 [Candidatus Pacebacteria bacterium]|nr:hypothetical protein [Candidatus Paceibacterota bacterium]
MSYKKEQDNLLATFNVQNIWQEPIYFNIFYNNKDFSYVDILNEDIFEVGDNVINPKNVLVSGVIDVYINNIFDEDYVGFVLKDKNNSMVFFETVYIDSEVTTTTSTTTTTEPETTTTTILATTTTTTIPEVKVELGDVDFV